jgi:L-alanine-DL-glutamate epimerase-like enolase superfamily enzyme
MRITAVEPILIQGREQYGTNENAVEATDNGDWQLLVKVTTNEDLFAWADVETLAPAAVAIIVGDGSAMTGLKTLSELLVGENPFDIERLWEKLYIGSAYYGRRGIAMQCMSAIDNCLWSIRAQATGLSIATLLGGRRRDSVTAYASTLFRDTPQRTAEAAAHYAKVGFRAVKFGWGPFGEDEGLDRELVAAARDALGWDRQLLIDPGWYPVGWRKTGALTSVRSRRDALSLCQWLANYRVGWVEDFIHPEHFEEYAYVRNHSPVPIAAGEQLATVWEFERFLRAGCVDIIQPDLSRCGGLTVAKRVADLAHDLGVDVVPHSWLTHLLTGYTLQYVAALPRARLIEFNSSQSELTRRTTAHPFKLAADGTIAIPQGPALGVEVDEDFVRTRQVSASAARVR